MKLVLIGFMGSGKSSVGRALAKTLDIDFLDMDYLVLTESGKNSISEIFEKEGEAFFRNLETKVAKEFGDLTDGVVSAGGGVVVNEETMKELQKNSKIIYLEVSFEEVLKRISDTSTRPLLRNLEKAKKLHKKRLPLYRQYADLSISTNGKNPEKIVKEILKKVCMIIGDPIEHTLSPKMHSGAYKMLRIDDKYLFLSSRVLPKDLEKTVEIFKTSGMKGLIITLPHKVEVMKYLDRIDPDALRIGAVNTIVNDKGKLIGYNTDWVGVSEPLKKRGSLKGKKVALFGAGGAARAALFGVLKMGAKATIYNRTLSHAKKLSKEFGCEYGSLDKIKDADIYINATKLGLNEDDPLPIPLEKVKKGRTVFDLVYRKDKETKLIEEAGKKGLQGISGVEMLIEQAIPQFKLYTGKDVSEEILRKALNEN